MHDTDSIESVMRYHERTKHHFDRYAPGPRAGLPKRASRAARLAAAMRGYVRFAEAHSHLFSLMFSSQHCNFSDPELEAAAAQSYGVLREIAAGLDWDKAEAPEASLRAAMMLWSLVHGYAQLSLNGQFMSDPATGRPLLSITDVTPSFGYRG